MKKFMQKRFLGLPIIVSFILTILVVTVVVAATIISNTWVSPNITVTSSGGGGGSPIPNSPLVVSSPDFTSARVINTGVSTNMSVTLTNPSLAGAPGYAAVLVSIRLYDSSDSSLVPGDITLEYSDGANWHALTLIQATGYLTTSFGPPAGFAVPTGYVATTPLRATFNTVGTYRAEAEVVTVP